MANQIDLDTAHSAILEALKAQFPAFQTVGDYGVFSVKGSNKLKVPAAALYLASFDSQDSGSIATDQLAITARWELRIVLDKRTQDFERQLCKISADVALWVQGNRFGLPAAPAEFMRAEPDQFDPAVVHLSPWVIEFEQTYLLGQSVWDGSGPVPSAVYVAYEPDTGPEHIDNYEKVNELPVV